MIFRAIASCWRFDSDSKLTQMASFFIRSLGYANSAKIRDIHRVQSSEWGIFIMQLISTATFEQLEEAVRGSIDGRFVLTGREISGWSIATSMAGRLMVQVGEEGAANFYEGVTHKDSLILYLTLNSPESMIINGQDLHHASLAIVPPKGLGVARTLTAVRVSMLTVPIDMLQTTQRFDPSDMALLAGSYGVVSVDSTKLASLRGVIERFMAIEEPLSEPAGRVAEEEFMAHILNTVASSAASDGERRGRPWVSREQVLTKIVDLIACADGEVLYVEDLCRAAGVSERTLRAIFNDTFGLGPIRYLRHRRLHLARTALRAARPGRDTVASIAADYGFWEFGRFAQEYRALFGELPSRTLGNTKHDVVVLDRSHTLTTH